MLHHKRHLTRLILSPAAHGLAWQGFGSRVLAYDIREDPAAVALGVEYVSKERVLQEADILSLHCPLLPSTYHIIDADRCTPAHRACMPTSGACACRWAL